MTPQTDDASGNPLDGHVWLTRAEAAKYARVSESTIDRARRSGRLDSVKIGTDGERLRRFNRVALDVWIASGGGSLLLALF